MYAAVSLCLLAFAALAQAQTYSATYLPSNAPKQSEQGQSGTNQCGTTSSQDSMCQNVYINDVTDFCLYAPPQPGANATIGDTERIEVSWCLQDGHGTRLMPNGTITGAHFVKTPDFVQVTGVGDLTKLNIPAGDEGGELDPHGADGNGNPIGGLVFSTAFGTLMQLHEWSNFMSDTEFCIRACKDGPGAPALCNHIYDVMGCMWNMPGNYSPGIFERCDGNSGEPMGVYGTSTFFQGEPVTPSAHPAPGSSDCTFLSTVGNNVVPTSNASSTSSSGSASITSASINSASANSSHPASDSSAFSSPHSSSPSTTPSSANKAVSGSRTGSASASPTGASQNNGAMRIGDGFSTGTAVAGLLVLLGVILGA